MSTDTHFNALVQDVEDAYQAAVAAVGELKSKMDELKSRLLVEAGRVGDAVEAGVTAAEEELAKPKSGGGKKS